MNLQSYIKTPRSDDPRVCTAWPLRLNDEQIQNSSCRQNRAHRQKTAEPIKSRSTVFRHKTVHPITPAPDTKMNKLYIGNLPIEADEAAVRQLFAEHNLTVADISVKRGGYAFVDFPDQSAADRAIDKLHGTYTILDNALALGPTIIIIIPFESTAEHTLP
ncbi:unnamed protein product, partial [Iphiclides podalirius]